MAIYYYGSLSGYLGVLLFLKLSTFAFFTFHIFVYFFDFSLYLLNRVLTFPVSPFPYSFFLVFAFIGL